ncbi:NAD-dependent epimerase/dehydratase family protein [Halanaerobium praevalens]|uniref:NAD-dependent epimerase/dehydratase n=1 Tax=Halanaerobium praevalens (strain ATCC 33744 / DSM 2228 / GSL) TaxID=572479 RepID=E3DNF6_HALPG|nr:NAD-dependent epimerase/dehydratase family protein [Halanaerobium praevalens]ADO76494.1 NAD-dependent epimerase/dehydratase [Halanaerobium praevalens DSM 2228]
MKSLITGAAGFIGSTLTEKLLKEGHQVIGVDCFIDYYDRSLKENNMSSFIDHENFTLIEYNINELDLKSLLKDVDYIFHQAAQAGVRSSWGEDFEIYTHNNIMGTQRLLEAARGSNIKKFVYASSSSVYGDTDKLPMKETNRLQPVSPYGVSKLAGENLCYLYYKNFNVPTVSLRYFTVFGERQRPDMAFHIFIKAILQDKKLTIFGDGKQSRNFTHVDDIVKANILAAESDVEGENFNIGGDGKRVVLNDAISLMEKIIGKKANREYQKVVKGDVKHTSADTSKAKKLLNYEAEIKFENGLEREINSLKNLYSKLY